MTNTEKLISNIKKAIQTHENDIEFAKTKIQELSDDIDQHRLEIKQNESIILAYNKVLEWADTPEPINGLWNKLDTIPTDTSIPDVLAPDDISILPFEPSVGTDKFNAFGAIRFHIEPDERVALIYSKRNHYTNIQNMLKIRFPMTSGQLGKEFTNDARTTFRTFRKYLADSAYDPDRTTYNFGLNKNSKIMKGTGRGDDEE